MLGAARAGGEGSGAFSKTGDPQLGQWKDAVILGRRGDPPDDLASCDDPWREGLLV